MRKSGLLNIVSTIIVILLAPFCAFSQTTSITIRSLLDPARSPKQYMDKGSIEFNAPSELRTFYTRNNFTIAWTDERDIEELLLAIRSIDGDGLDPQNYNLEYLDRLLTYGNKEHDAILDLALSDAFLELAHDLYQGRLNPEILFPGEWELRQFPADYAGLLAWALEDVGICETLQILRPMDNGYEGLKYMLSRFRQLTLTSDFPAVALGPVIKPNGIDDRMVFIRRRFSLLGLIPLEFDNEDIRYDSMLFFSVQKFQRIHGLFPDGTIGSRTQQALALSAEDYIESILVNLERYRWYQSRLLERSIQVNIPAADLIFSENESIELSMKAIIGRADRRTPVLSSSLTSITINPTWTIPPTILKEDVLPAIKTDLNYLQRHNIRVIDNRGRELDPDSIDWTTIGRGNIPYIFREDPGPRNPLGLIRFSFPNAHTVYLHDTNTPSLFSSPGRFLSSGCIRIEAPMKVLRLLLPGTGWTEGMIHDQINLGETRHLLIKEPIPIHIIYLTAFLRNDEFYMLTDSYGLDRKVFNALTHRETPLFR